MTIRLPKDVENSINAEVLSGYFATADDAIADGLGSIGAMPDAAAELDEAVEHAMNLRRQPWRIPAGE